MRRSLVAIGALAVVIVAALAVGYVTIGRGQTTNSSVSTTSTTTATSSTPSVSSTRSTSSTAQTTTTTTTTTTSTQEVPIKIVNVTIIRGASTNQSLGGYSPDGFTIFIGVNNTVTWTNNDIALHTVSSASGVFNSHDLKPGMSYTFTFNVPGTYTYSCYYHGWMHGMIVVKPRP